MRYVSYATKPSSPSGTWDRDDDDDAAATPAVGVPPKPQGSNERGGRNDGRGDWDRNDGNDSGSGKDWDRGRGDHNDHDDNADCRRSSGGQWRCSGHNGHSEGWDRDDALRKYLRLRPVIIQRPVIMPRPIIRGGQDVDIDVKNIYNIEQPDVAPPPPPVMEAPEPEISGGFSLNGLPSWALPAGAIGLVLVLVLLMKK